MGSLSCQKDLFDLDPEIHYLNAAYMSPNLRAVEEAGIKGIRRKSKPYLLHPEDFFTEVDAVRKQFAMLVETEAWERVALLPSVSYGLAQVVQNIPVKPQGNIILLSEQFPSNYYSWLRLAEKYDLELRIIKPGQDLFSRSEALNHAILKAIDDKTLAVACAPVHWAHGLRLDLDAIRAKTLAHQAWLVLDGTQSIGAMPFSVNRIQPDALIVGGYKWLLGPYSLGMAYYGPALDEGIPIEEAWINRKASDRFERLVDYQPEYRPYAGRYQVGEASNFALLPMLRAALDQLLDWGVYAIQSYCGQLIKEPYQALERLGVQIEPEISRASHLTGLYVPDDRFDRERLQSLFREHHVYVSNRGAFVRVAPHVYNTSEDLDALVYCFQKACR